MTSRCSFLKFIIRVELLPLAAWVVLGILFLARAPECAGQVVVISDPNLEQAIRESLNKPSGDLTTDDLQGLTALYATNRSITTLEGFTTASNLVVLDLSYNALSTVSLGAGFPSLGLAKFRGNGITNFTATGLLPSLAQLQLSENLITNVAFLQQTPLISYLELDYNELSAFDPGPGLGELIWLNLAFNYIQNLDFVARLPQLQDLFLDDNGLTNVVFPGPLTNLTYLTLDVNRISDMAFLTLVPNLERLDLAANYAEGYAFPVGLTNLSFLNLGQNHLTNVVFAQDMTNLTTLDLDDNRFTELPNLLPLYLLESLYLTLNQFAEVTIPYSLTNLTTLQLDSNPLNQLILPEVLATNSLAGLVTDLTNGGVSVLTYPFPPLLARPVKPASDSFHFELHGPPGVYEILNSPDAISWSLDGRATNPTVSIRYTSRIVLGAAYYRARLQ